MNTIQNFMSLQQYGTARAQGNNTTYTMKGKIDLSNREIRWPSH